MIPSLIELGLLASGLVAALALFLSVKHEIRAQSRQNRACLDRVLEQLQEARRPAPEAVALEHAARPAPSAPGPAASEPAAPEPAIHAPPQIALRSGMNLTKRVQAGRLLRRGEDVSHVAAALGVPRSEIELLIRVQELSARRAAGASG